MDSSGQDRDMKTFVRKVFQVAGVDEESARRTSDPRGRAAVGGELQLQLEQLMHVVATIRLIKVRHYGESRYAVSSPSYDLAMVYSDVERKLIRLRHQIFEKGAKVPAEQLIDSAVDLAAYGMMMLQIVFLLWREGLIEGSSTDTIEELARNLDNLSGLAGRMEQRKDV